MAEGAEDRTEAATPRRLQKAREEGQVALSREVGPAAGLATAALGLALLLPAAAQRLQAVLATLLQQADTLRPLDGLRMAALAGLAAALPLAGGSALAVLLAALAQSGGALRLSALGPSLDRLDLRRNLGRILGPSGLVELGRSLVKLGLAGFAAWHALSLALPWLSGALLWTPAALLDHMARLALHLLLSVLAVQAALAAADVVRARWSHGRRLRMTRQEVREEVREQDGDPQIKARVRRVRAARARRRMLAAVPTAAVVVTNPTHYAVALAYQRGSGGAPRVVAKGIDAMAARIRETAEQARVPLVADPPLARALHQVELDSEIPAALFQAVAEIIAYVWRLRRPAPARVA